MTLSIYLYYFCFSINFLVNKSNTNLCFTCSKVSVSAFFGFLLTSIESATPSHSQFCRTEEEHRDMKRHVTRTHIPHVWNKTICNNSTLNRKSPDIEGPLRPQNKVAYPSSSSSSCLLYSHTHTGKNFSLLACYYWLFPIDNLFVTWSESRLPSSHTYPEWISDAFFRYILETLWYKHCPFQSCRRRHSTKVSECHPF